VSHPFGPVTDYLPHRPPMLLIDDIVDATADRVVCRTTIHPDCVFAKHGLVHPSAMIELAAQACAIHAGVTAAPGGAPPRMGLLVGCREISFAVDSFAVGDELTIVATRLAAQDPLATFTATVTRRDVVCVTLQLSVIDAEHAQLPGEGEGP
jgi:predicted hotdog family 3-hydroxylacyl-ACP dehydratase